MTSVTSISTEPLNHLGIVAGMIKDLGIPEKIDTLLGEKKQATKFVSVSECVSAMIINCLGFTNKALYLVPNFFSNKPVDRLISPNVTAAHLNDDALGNALDIIAEFGITKFFSNISFPIAQERKYGKRFAHIDTTSFSLEGNYERFGDESNSSTQVIRVTHGHSKKHRPDLKQIVVSMVCSGNSNFPYWIEPLSGNSSDQKNFHETIATVREFQRSFGDIEDFCWVGDSALYSKTMLLQDFSDYLWITRVPEKIKEAKCLVHLELSDDDWVKLDNGYKISSHTSNYGDVSQRWLLVFSEQAYERESKTLKKRIKIEFETLSKKMKHLSNDAFACVPDAEKKIEKIIKKLKYHSISYKVKTKLKHKKAGRPKLNDKGAKKLVYIVPEISQNEEAIEYFRRGKGRFILATNDLDKIRLPDENILIEYKAQSGVEKGFKFLKDSTFLIDKIYLKTPNRIAALTAVMALSLMVYNSAEFEMRRALKSKTLTLPNQLKKEVENPTLKWVFKLMDGITIVHIKIGDIVQREISDITPLRKKIILLFEENTRRIYETSPTKGVQSN